MATAGRADGQLQLDTGPDPPATASVQSAGMWTPVEGSPGGQPLVPPHILALPFTPRPLRAGLALGADDDNPRIELEILGNAGQISLYLHAAGSPDGYVATFAAAELIDRALGFTGVSRDELAAAGAALPLPWLLTASPGRFVTAGFGLLRLNLFELGGKQSYAVFDTRRAAKNLADGSLSGLNPVAGELHLGEAGSLARYDGYALQAGDAMPAGVAPLGDAFEIPNATTLRKHVLGRDDDGPVLCDVHWGEGTLAVRLRASDQSGAGFVASVDVEYLLAKLEALGEAAAELAGRVRAKLAAGVDKILKLLDGVLKLDLDGSWLAFDLKLQLPRLGGGGGLNLAGLIPSFKVDLGGLSLMSMPQLPWFSGPAFGSFPLPSVDLHRLLSQLQFSLPDGIELPGISALFKGIDLNGLRFGIGVDFSPLKDLIPAFGGGQFGIELDLAALLEKLGDGARNLVDKLLAMARRGGAALRRYLHLSSDGILRIFDSRNPDGQQVAFDLKKLFDGAQPEDLVPVELRLVSAGFGSVEYGQAEDEDPAKGQVLTPKPGGDAALSLAGVDAPAAVTDKMGLADSTVDLHVYLAGDWATLWVGVDEGNQGIVARLNLARLQSALGDRIPLPGMKVPKLGRRNPFHFREDLARKHKGVAIGIGPESPGDDYQGLKGHAAWSLERILAGGLAPESMIPNELVLDVPGKGTLTLGTSVIDAAAGALVGKTNINGAPDAVRMFVGESGPGPVGVWLFYGADQITLGVTPSVDDPNGVAGSINGQYLLDKLAQLGDAAAQLARRIGEHLKAAGAAAAAGAGKVLDLIGGVLAFELEGNKIGFDLGVQLPRLFKGGGLDLSGLLPTRFELKLGAIDLSMLPSLSLPGPRLGGFNLEGAKLKKLLSMLPSLPRLPDLGSLDIDFNLVSEPELQFGLGFNLDKLGVDWASMGLPDLGTLGIQVDLAGALGKLGDLRDWLASKLKLGGGDLTRYLHLDPNTGILRIYDEKEDKAQRNHVAFDLTAVLDGFDGSDLVPVELQLVAEGMATMAFGQAEKDDPKGDRVAAVRPAGKALVTERGLVPPAFLLEHLGADERARMQVELFITDGADHVQVFASLTRDPRGLLIDLDTRKLQSAVARLPIPAKLDALGSGDGGGLAPDLAESKRRGGLFVTFGAAPAEAGEEAQDMSGFVFYRLSRFLAADGFSASMLIPDEFHVDTPQGLGVSIGQGIDLRGKGSPRATVPTPAAFADALGGASQTNIYASTTRNLREGARITLAAVKPDEKKPRFAPGLELTINAELMTKLHHWIGEKLTKAHRSARKFARRGQRADLGKRDVAIALVPELGLRVGTRSGDNYAVFGWESMLQMVTGDFDADSLVPVAFKVDVKGVSLEATPYDPSKEGAGADEDTGFPSAGTLDQDTFARRVRELPPLFGDVLSNIGVKGADFLQINGSQSTIQDGKPAMAQVVGNHFRADTEDENRIVGGTTVTFACELDMLLRFLPAKVRRDIRADQAPKKDLRAHGKRRSKDLSFGVEDGGIALSFASSKTRAGKTRTINVKAGWTFQKLLEVLMSIDLDRLAGGEGEYLREVAGILTPSSLSGEFGTSRIGIRFTAEEGKLASGGHTVPADIIPGVGNILAQIFGDALASTAQIHLLLPDAESMKKNIYEAFANNTFVWIGAEHGLAAMTIEGKEKDAPAAIFAINVGLSKWMLEKLIGIIPGIGQYYRLGKKLLGVFTDPVGTMKSIKSAPEGIYLMFKHGGDIFDNIDWSDPEKIFAGLMMNDADFHQGVDMLRAYDRLKENGWKPGKKLTGDDALRAGFSDPDEAAKFANWITKLDEQGKLDDMLKLNEVMEKHGLGGKSNGDISDFDYDAANRVINKAPELERLLKAGYKDFISYKDAVDSGDEAAAKEHQERLEKLVDKYIQAGAKAGPTPDKKDDEFADDLTETKKPSGQVDEHTKDLDDIGALPELTDEQRARAEKLFKQGPGLHAVQRDYLIQKFGHLNLNQLANLIEAGIGGSTQVATANGKSYALIVNGEAEYDFVALLFQNLAGLSGKKTGDKPTGDKLVESAKNMVKLWRLGQKLSGKPAQDKDKKDSGGETADEDKKGDKKGKGTGGEEGDGAGDKKGDGKNEDDFEEEWGTDEEAGDGDPFADPLEQEDETTWAEDAIGKDQKRLDQEAKEAAEGGETSEKGTGGGGSAEEGEESLTDPARAFVPTAQKAYWLTRWDADKGELVEDEDNVKQAVSSYQKKLDDGTLVTLVDVDVDFSPKNLAADGKPAIYEYHLEVEYKVHSDPPRVATARWEFFHERPESGQATAEDIKNGKGGKTFERSYGGGQTVMELMAPHFEVPDPAKDPTALPQRSGSSGRWQLQDHILQIVAVKSLSPRIEEVEADGKTYVVGMYPIELTVTIVRAGTKTKMIQDKDGGWHDIADDATVTLALTLTHVPEPVKRKWGLTW